MVWFGVSIIFALVAIVFIVLSRKIASEKERIFEEKIKLENITVSLEEKIEELEEEYRKYREEHIKEYSDKPESKEVIGYEEFLKNLSKEIDRKKRKEELKFAVLLISVDFFDEYKQMYSNLDIMPLQYQIVKFLEGQIRKIDVIAHGEDPASIYMLLPMTSAEGAVILGARLQKKSEDFKIEYSGRKLVATLTISICEVQNSEETQEIIEALYIMKKEGEEKGGNIVKIVKI